MVRSSRYSADQKIAIVCEYLNGDSTRSTILKRYGISAYTLKEWVFHYKTTGHEWFISRPHNRGYSSELKYQAVQDSLSGKYTQHEILAKYGIKHRSRLKKWISMYNGCGSLKSSGNGGASVMTKGRETTWKERIDIVLYCKSTNCNYAATSQEYQVSYQQVYQWVRKYDSGGEDALKDGRGRTKTEGELTDADKQRLAMKKLESENERLRAENLFLKKLKQLRGE